MKCLELKKSNFEQDSLYLYKNYCSIIKKHIAITGKYESELRYVILKKIFEEEGEFSVNDILCSVSEDISQRTVYYYLKLFDSLGIIKKVPSTDNKLYFILVVS